MTDLEVIEVNVNVVDVKTKEQHEQDSTSLQDRVSDALSKGAKKSKETLSDSVDKVTSDNKSSVVSCRYFGSGVQFWYNLCSISIN
jgi:hypothetical protein